jgi:hypothetical protein
MALGKRKRERQSEAFVTASDLPRSPGHPFYTALNRLLAENDSDSFVVPLCAPFYAGVMGRPWIPPGVFFRMTIVGWFEGQPSHRGIAWRRATSGRSRSSSNWGRRMRRPATRQSARCTSGCRRRCSTRSFSLSSGWRPARTYSGARSLASNRRRFRPMPQ